MSVDTEWLEVQFACLISASAMIDHIRSRFIFASRAAENFGNVIADAQDGCRLNPQQPALARTGARAIGLPPTGKQPTDISSDGPHLSPFRNDSRITSAFQSVTNWGRRFACHPGTRSATSFTVRIVLPSFASGQPILAASVPGDLVQRTGVPVPGHRDRDLRAGRTRRSSLQPARPVFPSG